MSARRLSKTSRGSKKSGRGSMSSASVASKLELSPSFIENTLQKVLEKEEEDSIIYSIREELIHRAMEECQSRYLEKQAVKFTVHCAYRALTELVNLGVFYHDAGKPFYTDHPSWAADEPPEPSPPDTWAVHKVPIKPKPPPEAASTVSSPYYDLDSKASLASETSQPENVFTGVEARKERKESDELSVIYQASSQMYMRMESIMEDEFQGLIPPNVTEVSVVGEEAERMVPTMKLPSVTSIFTETTRMRPEDLPRSIKSGRSKIKGLTLDATSTQPEFNRDDLPPMAKFSASNIPPLRKETKCVKVRRPSLASKDKSDSKKDSI